MNWYRDVEALLGRDVLGRLAALGFVPNAKSEFFERHDRDQVQRFGIRFVERASGMRIETSAGVRFEEVERIIHRTSGFDSRAAQATSTLGASIRTLRGGIGGEYELAGPVQEIRDSIERDLDFAMAFYSTYSSLKTVDAALNQDISKPCPLKPMEWLRASAGIVSAFLLCRSDWEQLAEAYISKLKRFSKGFYLGRFELLLADLRSLESAREQQ